MFPHPFRTLLSLVLTVCLIGLLPLRAAAWGSDGHKIVAGIAYWRLQQLHAKNALKNISKILTANLGAEEMDLRPWNIYDAAVWPDDIRNISDYNWAKPLHFVSIPLDKKNDPTAMDKYDQDSVCISSAKIPEGVCVIGGLNHYLKVLSTPSSSKKDRLEAVSFIIHFMGDIHQPLHTSEDKTFINFMGGNEDRGGNYRFIFYLLEKPFTNDDPDACVKMPSACTDSFKKPNGKVERSNKQLHAAWDKYMIRTEMENNPKRGDFKAYVTDLVKVLPANPADPKYAAMEAGDFKQWADESHHLAELNAYALIGSTKKISPADKKEYEFYLLNDAYRAKNIKVVDQQLIRGGIRLAAVLRRIFPDAS